MKSGMLHFARMIRTNVQSCLIQILKESLVQSFFVECFLMFIFSVLVT